MTRDTVPPAALPVARWPLEPAAALLTSVVLRGESPPGGDGWRPGIDALERFIDAWGRWFHGQVVHWNRLDLMQGRGLVIAMAGLAHDPGPVARLARAARAVGLATEVTLDADDVLEECPAPPGARVSASTGLEALLSTVDGVYLRLEASTAERQPDRVRALVDRLVAARPALHLAAPPQVLRRLGLLQSPAFCARYLTVFAEAPRPGRPVQVDGVESAPCRAHLRLYIDADGHLYPCAGLFGLPQARLGHIEDRDPAPWFESAQRLDLSSLALHGPALHEAPPAPFDLCGLHRHQLTCVPRPEAA